MTQNTNKNLIVAFLVVVLISAGALFYYQRGKGPESQALSPQEIEERVLNYIRENVPGTEVSMVSIAKEGALYRLTLKLGEQEFLSYVTQDGKLLFPQAIDLEAKPLTPPAPTSESEGEYYTIGNFSVSGDTLCKEGEKPVVYFFSSEGCSHCQWESPIIQKVAARFKDNIVFRHNTDPNTDKEIFQKYSTGGVPTLVLGCKYYRVGSGESLGEEEEEKVLTALMCKLTNSQLAGVCDAVQDLIKQIEG